MIFPIFRSLENHLVFYRISSESEFTELKITGNYYSINSYYASQYPEKLKIRERKILLEESENYIGKIINAVDESGLAKKTVIIFFSDNGGL